MDNLIYFKTLSAIRSSVAIKVVCGKKKSSLLSSQILREPFLSGKRKSVCGNHITKKLRVRERSLR